MLYQCKVCADHLNGMLHRKCAGEKSQAESQVCTRQSPIL